MTTQTATPAPAIIAEVTIESYRAMDAKAKGKARNRLHKAMLAYVGAGQGNLAKMVLDHLNSLTGDTTATKPTVDPNVLIATRIRTLRTAADMLESGRWVPDGTDPATVAHGKIVRALSDPSGREDANQANALATAKITRSAPTNDIAQIILDALEAAPTGAELAISTIANTKPGVSDGAVAARLFDKNGPKPLTGALIGRVVAIEATADKPRRVRLA